MNETLREKVDKINAIPLRDILEEYGYEPVKTYNKGYLMYNSPFRDENAASFMVGLSTNRWKDFGEDSSGSVIDFVMRAERCSFSQALQKLEDKNFTAAERTVQASPARPKATGSKLVVDNSGPLHNKLLLDYVSSRGIDPDIARAYCREVYYHFEGNARKNFALGFQNDHEGIELRNPMFKGCAFAKDITCFDNGSDRCAVFEGFFDFLSYLQYSRNHPELKLPNMDFCILNSTALIDRAKDFLSRHPKVHSFMDNDTSGRNALEKMKILVPRGTIVMNESANLYSKHNDFNEFLQACKKKVRAVECEM